MICFCSKLHAPRDCVVASTEKEMTRAHLLTLPVLANSLLHTARYCKGLGIHLTKVTLPCSEAVKFWKESRDYHRRIHLADHNKYCEVALIGMEAIRKLARLGNAAPILFMFSSCDRGELHQQSAVIFGHREPTIPY